MRKRSEYVVEMTKEQFEKLVDATWEEYVMMDIQNELDAMEEQEEE